MYGETVLQIDVEYLEELEEWENAVLLRHSEPQPVPSHIEIEDEEYLYAAMAEPRGSSDATQPYIVYPVEEDGSLPDDFDWELAEEYQIGKQLGLGNTTLN